MKWTREINENVMRAYYGATEGGTNLTAYRVRMLSLFQALEPTIETTDQRLSDQVRFIQRRHLLDEPTLERLRSTAEPIHSTVSSNITDQPATNVISAGCVSSNSVDDEADDLMDMTVSSQYIEQLRGALEFALSEYSSMSSTSRPRLPRLPIHKRNLCLVRTMDSILPSYLESSHDICNTHSILYCAATAVCRVARVKFPDETRAKRHTSGKPAWQYRIESRIEKARVLIGKLLCFRSGNTRPRIMRFVAQAFNGTGIEPDNYLAWATERIDYLKQKVYAWANRIRRYGERMKRYIQNRNFQCNEKGMYRDWERPNDRVGDRHLPNMDSHIQFWKNIWSRSVSHSEGDWFDDVKRACEPIQEMEDTIISPHDVTCAIHLTANWKSPGPDGLHNFWLKWLRNSHAHLASKFQECIENGSLPAFMTTGVTHLLFKSGSATDVKNYRPITCLPTIYKLLTSILRTKITNHLKNNNILSWTQNGCKAGTRGTKELLLVDMTICQQVKRNRKNLFSAWIDYKKAYDSVPHTWLMRVLELYKINTSLRTFLSSCMSKWITVLSQHGSEWTSAGSVEHIRIERGIFQGDSLSPLWFCLALNPLSTLLQGSGLGYRLRRGGMLISHLLYMDDLKLFAPKKSDLMELLKITETFSSSICMEFGADKCAVLHVKQGNVVNSESLQLSEQIHFRSLSEVETYKYLGMSESLGINSREVKQSVMDRFFSRLTKVLNSFLSGGNKVRAFNGWVMPLLMYSFGILKWTQTELDALDRKVRRILTSHRMHHPRSSVMRLYIPRRYGGRGFLNAKNLHNREVNSLREYFLNVAAEVHNDVIAVDKGLTPLSLAKQNWRTLPILSTSDRLEVWKSKELHGRFYQALMEPSVDQLASVSWLRFGNLFGETEGFICAIMDEVINTKNYRKYIMKDGTSDICRACHRPGESLRHIVSGCSFLANTEYLHRHNQVARIIHQQLALRYDLVVTEVPYYRYTPPPVLENDRATLYWDRSIITDRTIVANKPDIVLVDRSARQAMLVDVTVPHDGNLVKAENDKLTKYLDLAHEVTAMWDVDSTIIVPIVVSTNGLIAKSLDQHLKRLSLDSWVKSQIQKAALLDTARIVRRFLTLEP